MNWPFITRERLEEAISVRDQQIAKLEAEVEALNHERKRLSDFISLKSNGASIYGELNPPTQAVEEEEEPPKRDPLYVPGDVEEARERVGPRARAIRDRVEKRNDAQYEADRAAAQALLRSAKLEGIQRAEASVISGNGNH